MKMKGVANLKPVVLKKEMASLNFPPLADPIMVRVAPRRSGSWWRRTCRTCT